MNKTLTRLKHMALPNCKGFWEIQSNSGAKKKKKNSLADQLTSLPDSFNLSKILFPKLQNARN